MNFEYLMRWAGSKKWLVPRIQAELVGSKRYIEPFLGSGAVFLNIDPHVPAFAGDENEELVLTFRSVRDEPRNVLSQFSNFENSREGYMQAREMDRSPKFSEEMPSLRAARLLFLNQTCFNGLYRVNGRGEFNVPYGKREVNFAEFEKRLLLVSTRLQQMKELVQTENVFRQDFRMLLAETEPGDFVYLDPPYFSASQQGSFVGYTAGGFNADSHDEILKWMAEASNSGVKALLSNGNSDWLVKSANNLGLKVEHHSVHRRISATASSRGPAGEVVIANF